MTHDVVDRIGERIDPWDSPEQRIAEHQVERRLRFLRWSVPVLLTVALLVAAYRGLDVGRFDPEALLGNHLVELADEDAAWAETTVIPDGLLVSPSRVHTLEVGEPRTFRWYWQLSPTTLPHTLVDASIESDCVDQRAYVTDATWSDEVGLPLPATDVPFTDSPIAWLVLEVTTTDACVGPKPSSTAKAFTVLGLPHPTITYRSTALPLDRSVSAGTAAEVSVMNLTNDLGRWRACNQDNDGLATTSDTGCFWSSSTLR